MSDFVPHTPPTHALRRQYLAALDAPQEWFLEELIALGQAWTHADGTYAITHQDTLVEFCSADPAQSAARLQDFQRQQGVTGALVKSFDKALVQACAHLGWTGVVGGILFRKRLPRPPSTFDGAKIRAARAADQQAIWQINDGFFDSEAEVADQARANALWTVTVGGEIAGCGLTNRVIPGEKAVDIGMMVAPEFRRRGLGTYIISALADTVVGEGSRPICGCGASNRASKATLEKAGFVSEHQLLSFRP